MRGGFRPLVNPGCRISEVDLAATQATRQAIREDVLQRQFIEWIMGSAALGIGAMSVASMPVAEQAEGDDEDDPGAVIDGQGLAS